MDSVDYTRQTADSAGEDEVGQMLNSLRAQFPHFWFWHDPVALKRMRDEMEGALAGQDTTAGEDARLRQESPEGPALNRKFDDEFWAGTNAEDWRKKNFGKL